MKTNSIAWLAIVMSLLAGCDQKSAGPDPVQVQARNAQTRAFEGWLRDSNRVVVTEHSNRHDGGSNDTPRIVYGTRQLDPQEKQKLASLTYVPKTEDQWAVVLAAEQFEEGKRCAFIPHHSIMFYRDNVEMATIEICFQCDEMTFNDKKVPFTLLQGLSFFIHEVGFEPKRDWSELARQHAPAKSPVAEESDTPPPGDSRSLFQRGHDAERRGDIHAALRLYTRAARIGSGEAAEALGDIYSDGKGDVPKDYAKALSFYAIADKAGIKRKGAVR